MTDEAKKDENEQRNSVPVERRVMRSDDYKYGTMEYYKEVFKGAETVDLKSYEEQLKATKDLDELKKVWTEVHNVK